MCICMCMCLCIIEDCVMAYNLLNTSKQFQCLESNRKKISIDLLTIYTWLSFAGWRHSLHLLGENLSHSVTD